MTIKLDEFLRALGSVAFEEVAISKCGAKNAKVNLPRVNTVFSNEKKTLNSSENKSEAGVTLYGAHSNQMKNSINSRKDYQDHSKTMN